MQAAAYASTTGASLLHISTFPAPDPSTGHTFATAVPILITPDPTNLGTVTTQPGTIRFAGDVDYFSFVAPTTGQMTIRQNAPIGGPLDSYLYVYAGNQTLIWQNDNSNNTLNSLISIPVAAGMTYYAEATGHNASVRGLRALVFHRAHDA